MVSLKGNIMDQLYTFLKNHNKFEIHKRKWNFNMKNVCVFKKI